MRLTLEIIGEAQQLCGPNKERILSLRGNTLNYDVLGIGLKVPAIENLGATGDLFDSIDLCGNSLIRLDNFPPLHRLDTLLVANNRVAKLDPDILHNLPNLKSLVLTTNRLTLISDLVPLTKGKTIERLSFVENPVASLGHYRHYLIHRIPTLRFLDFSRITDAERLAAKQVFSGPAGASLLTQIEGTASHQSTSISEQTVIPPVGIPTVVPPRETNNQQPTLSEDEVTRLREAIARAPTLVEVQRLEEALKQGVLPQDLQDTEM